MKDFLFEIFSEEIPASMQLEAKEQLKQLAQKILVHPLKAQEIETFVTPRRLALILKSVQLQPVQPIEKQGPLVMAGSQALEGFCRSWNISSSQCVEKETPKGKVWAAVITPLQRSIEDYLIDLSKEILRTFLWPKRMRWFNSQTWVRPIRRLVMMYGQIPLDSDSHLRNVTEGHRLWAYKRNPQELLALHDLRLDSYERSSLSSSFVIDSPSTYEAQLKKAYVILRQEERAQRIKDELCRLADKVHCIPSSDEELIEENAGLTEWPTGLLGDFDSSFLILPPPVITTTLKVHQRCFPLLDSSQHMAPYFVAITNSLTHSPEIKKGYERVIGARLADALFFWEQDKKHSLLWHKEKLKNRLFFQGLGSLVDKMDRLERLAPSWIQLLEIQESAEDLKQVARLSKADLATSMVGEFPSLQGIMGYYYAMGEGLPLSIAQALQDQYAVGKSPVGPLGTLMAMMDHLDSLVGFFALGHTPSGSKDPMGLKRSAFIVIKGCLDYSFSLRQAIELVLKEYHAQGFRLQDCTEALLAFFKERLAYQLELQGLPTAHVSAALTQPEAWQHYIRSDSEKDHLYKLAKRAEKLKELMDSSVGQEFLVAYRRVYALAHHLQEALVSFDLDLLTTPQEQKLIELLHQGSLSLDLWIKPLHEFFDHIRVTDPKYQESRLGLLHKIMAAFAPLGHLPLLMHAH